MNRTGTRTAGLSMSREEFLENGHFLVDQLAEFYDSLGDRKVTSGESPSQIRKILGDAPLPLQGTDTSYLFKQVSEWLIDHSLFNGHPKFFGYITSSPSPVGALADMLAAAINPNVGANILSPMATAMERQTVKWLAEFIGVPETYGGILVSGGNMANLTAFLAARTAKGPANLKEEGLLHAGSEMVFYCSRATHTWIEKAATLFGHGTRAIRWIPVDDYNKMDTVALAAQIEQDLKEGRQPFLVVGNAGDVSTGVVDDLAAIAKICKQYDLWFHVDGAYGVPAAVVPGFREMFAGMEEADSIALDPHKWLYAPLEAGCTLVRDPRHLINTYSSHPVYYNFDASEDEPSFNYYEYGFQNSRGFRALKVWMGLQQAGRSGYEKMINEDISLSRLMHSLAMEHPELEAVTQNLSISTFRYIPLNIDSETKEEFINRLNEQLLNRLQKNGKVFLSNAVVSGKYCLRACIVNFRTTEKDIRESIDIIVEEGRALAENLE